MLDELAGRALLDGVRGRASVDRGAFVDVLMKVQRLALDLSGELAELDINPSSCGRPVRLPSTHWRLCDDSGCAMTEPELLASRVGSVLTLTINRPEQQNALTHDVRTHWSPSSELASADLAVRAVVLTAVATAPSAPAQTCARVHRCGQAGGRTGARDGRCRAGDPRRLAAADLCDPRLREARHRCGQRHAAGGGAHLALACDLVLAADTARFIEVFVRSWHCTRRRWRHICCHV